MLFLCTRVETSKFLSITQHWARSLRQKSGRAPPCGSQAAHSGFHDQNRNKPSHALLNHADLGRPEGAGHPHAGGGGLAAHAGRRQKIQRRRQGQGRVSVHPEHLQRPCVLTGTWRWQRHCCVCAPAAAALNVRARLDGCALCQLGGDQFSIGLVKMLLQVIMKDAVTRRKMLFAPDVRLSAP